MALVLAPCAIPAAWAADVDPPPATSSARLVVRYLDDGPNAVEGCGVRLHALGDHAGATRDHSDSLDRLHDRYRVRRVAALFRDGEAGAWEAQRAALETRVRAGIARRSADRGFDPMAGRTARPDDDALTPQGSRVRSAGAADESELARAARRLAHVYTIELGPDVDPQSAAAAYAADPHVAWARVDEARVLDAFGDDPFLSSEGSWGQPYADLWGHHRIRAVEAWALGRGEGVVVAVVDSGLDWLHPDIADNVWVNPGEDLDGNGRVDADDWNGIDDDGNGYVDDLMGFDFVNSLDANGDGDYLDPDDVNDADPFDDNGHGTHVAGIIAATADNGEGIAGVAPGARIMALKGFAADGSNSDALLWRAVLYAALNGAHVVNNSWSCGEPCPRNPLAEEVVALVHAMGVVIVTSAGNRSRDVVAFSPENMWQTLTVGSSDVFDAPSASFTNQGFGMDLLAPGGDPQDTPGVFVPRRNILSLLSSEANPTERAFAVGDRYLRWAGTSMAAPQVAGAVALLRAQRPWLEPDAIRRMIRRSAVDLGPPGHDFETGAGRLDARALLEEPDPPDWVVRVEAPRPSSWFDPIRGEVVVRGTIAGPDLAGYVVRVGQGQRPTHWIEIARSRQPVEDGAIAIWRTEGLPSGAWLIHVEAESRDGRRADEFIPVSLEGLRFDVLSSDGPAAERPAIVGRRVVWTTRRGLELDAFGRFDLDLFEHRIGDRHGDGGRPLLRRPGDQTRPALSRSRRGWTVSWLDRAPDALETRAYACRVGGPAKDCTPVALAPDELVTLAPAPSADRVYWLDGSTGDLDLRSCRFGRAGLRCTSFDPGLAPARRSWLDGDGRGTLSWSIASQGSAIALCRLGWLGGCAETPLVPRQRAYTRAAASGDLVAWVEPRLSGERPLRACSVGDGGACDPIQVAPHAEDDRIRVSDDVIVWEAEPGDEASDVFFCEFDRLRQRCPAQRLTAELSLQTEADIDARRVVWVDERFGAGRVLATELPGWLPVRARTARVGRPVTIVAWLDEAGHGPVELRAELDGSLAPTTLEITRIHRKGAYSLARLRWRPTGDDLGDRVVTLEAETRDGLVARRSIRIQVEPEHRPGEAPSSRASAAHELLPIEARP